jgi:alanyl-tRNA synthetase/REP element-mobilizing transposase RayT
MPAPIPTSAEIRRSFLDFFREKQHTVVPSSSLLPDSPNLLFTNAGMNQFVPIFLNEVPCPYVPGRAADTQKCIRAGGKHNDLDDVGLDTYHHTFFEMLGNWSFGDYFKKEAIGWSWELIVERLKFPPNRVYATIYQPGPRDPSERDQEAWDLWAEKFRGVGLDPDVHIVPGNKKDNFWMMGETGPCGPCSEIHIDLTPAGDTRGALVNKGAAECIEIWNNVFIQFNANADGTFTPLPAQHVDTGMGFERLTSIIQGTKNFTDFANARISNYETDIFRPIFDELEKMCGHRYGSTLPQPNAHGQIIPESGQEKIDVAFRVIGDHIRTLSFAIADGIQPGNTDRNYVLRRILRRAVRYGRTLEFQEPFFHKLVDVLARTMGDVFPEIRARKKHVEEVLQREEEAFNRTLDKGIEIFEREAARLRSAPASGAGDRAPAVSIPGSTQTARYSKRNLPHFERPWGKYHVTFSTRGQRQLAPSERDIVMASILHGHRHGQYHLFAACVMSDHVHLLFEPQIKGDDPEGRPVFYPLGEILHGIKSTTAHRINKAASVSGTHVWEEESHDRLIRGESDLQEKFSYVCRNPWDAGLLGPNEDYPWLWTSENDVSREGAGNDARGGRGPREGIIPGDFAFKLYDTYGFPLDLTELMARERGLAVDTTGFEVEMEKQRSRARAAQKKQVIELSEVETKEPTKFVGYDSLSAMAKVLEVVSLKDRTAVILDASAAYAEMGGQVGDTGELIHGADVWRIASTQKAGHTWLHFLEGAEAPAVGREVTLAVDAAHRAAIQRHHTVTHLLHWALHEVVSREATQKGSFVGADKLTFDFNSAALTPAQVRDIERLVNERIVENAPVQWNEVPYAEVKGRADIMQFFGDKYGENVRVVDIGGYSKELCAGTHTRATGEIGLFRIASEAAIAAGVRRIEAQAGLPAYDLAAEDARRLLALATKIGTPLPELEKRLDTLLAQQRELEKTLKAANQREAAGRAKDLLNSAQLINGIPTIIANLGPSDGDTLQTVADAIKSHGFTGLAVLGGSANGAVALVATVSPDFTAKIQAGKVIQAIAPLVGGKGGGKPDNARGGGKDPSQLDAALEAARQLVAGA